jgi:hypothetical protein
MKIYVATSWRNEHQPILIKRLRKIFGEQNVYDFQHPAPGKRGFQWDMISPAWRGWSAEEYINALDHPVAQENYRLDFEAMQAADVCVLLLPCGRSAHLEAGWMKGAGKKLVIVTDDKQEPELMNKMADAICEWWDIPYAISQLQEDKK